MLLKLKPEPDTPYNSAITSLAVVQSSLKFQ